MTRLAWASVQECSLRPRDRRRHRLLARLLIACVVLVGACLSTGAALAAAVSNGSFETGDFSGWTPSATSSLLCPWVVLANGATSCYAGSFGIANTPPAPDGSHYANVSFDGGGPEDILLSQVVTISAPTLSWSDFFSWTMESFGATQPRSASVELRDQAGTSILSTLNTFTAQPSTTGTVGWTTHSADVSAFIGRTVRLTFRLHIPEDYTGPGSYSLDNVHLGGVVPEPNIGHIGYCSVEGNFNPFSGAPIPPGTFLMLVANQPKSDPAYKGAYPANFVDGLGITCDPPPAGYVQQGFAPESLHVPGNVYPYWVKGS